MNFAESGTMIHPMPYNSMISSKTNSISINSNYLLDQPVHCELFKTIEYLLRNHRRSFEVSRKY